MRINEQIDAKAVLLIDDKGTQLGVMPVAEALAHASERSLDLVEVAPNGNPVVCKLLDYGRFSYHEKKKRNEARAKQHKVITKMVKFRPNTFKGDYEVKINKIRRFLGAGDKVKVVMQFKGREIIHAQHGFQLFKDLAAELEGEASIDSPPSAEGKFIHMMLVPSKRKEAAPANGNGAADKQRG